MRTHLGKLATFVLLTFACVAHAQETDGRKTIDLFDDQGSMQATAIEVESGGDSSDFGSDAPESVGIGGGFMLKFERTGNTILVPAQVGSKSVYFIFDTGAAFTSLTSDIARQAGFYPGSDSPSITLTTANGPRAALLGVMRSLTFGGRRHSGVTFTILDERFGMYKGKPVVGLLGMNVIGRYQTNFDHGRGELLMRPAGDYSDRWRDISPFLQVRHDKTEAARGGKSVNVFVKATNRAPRTIDQLTFRVRCDDGTTTTDSKRRVAAGSTVTLKLNFAKACQNPSRPEVVDARW